MVTFLQATMKRDSIFFSFWTRCSRHSRLARGGTSSCVPNQKGWFMIFTGKWNLGLWFEILRSLEENNHHPPHPLLPCTTIGTSSSSSDITTLPPHLPQYPSREQGLPASTPSLLLFTILVPSPSLLHPTFHPPNYPAFSPAWLPFPAWRTYLL